MKRFIALISAFLFVVSGTPASAATDTRVFQYSPNDKSDPKGNPSGEWDITQLQLGLTTEDEMEFFLLTRKSITDAQFGLGNNFALLLDVNLDKKADFQIDQTGEFDSNYMRDRSLIRISTGEVVECEAYGWITNDADAVGWQIPKSCLVLRTEINVAATYISEDGTVFDRLPDGTSWQRFKTGYMAASACSSAQSGQKVTYDGTTWVCMRSSGKWGWRDYAPIAAKSARYATEKAFYACKLNSKFGAKIADGGKTLILDGAFKYIITEKDYNCVVRNLSMPVSVQRRVEITRALDGLQEASWGRLSAFWNYHPDSGLNITFSQN
ncbi:MAG: hypothetical protein EBS38_02190 [Actinobacteria bacterium]|nr:hypothetical protein [Actinomycetota bacterium]